MPIAAGEQLTELQALQALLLPSANNIAAVLARWDAGSADRFVARMNATARSLGMTHTRYTDPSGYDAATVSTAADQVRVVDRAMRLPVFASIVATPSATLPVAGTVHNTNTCSGTTGSSASRPARPPRPAAASPSGRSAGSTAGGRRSPGSCWASPATTGSRRVSRPPTPWSTASPVTGLRPERRQHGHEHRLLDRRFREAAAPELGARGVDDRAHDREMPGTGTSAGRRPSCWPLSTTARSDSVTGRWRRWSSSAESRAVLIASSAWKRSSFRQVARRTRSSASSGSPRVGSAAAVACATSPDGALHDGVEQCLARREVRVDRRAARPPRGGRSRPCWHRDRPPGVERGLENRLDAAVCVRAAAPLRFRVSAASPSQ